MIPHFPLGSRFSLGFSPPSLRLWKLQRQIDASVMELTHSCVNGARHLNRLFSEDMNILTHPLLLTAAQLLPLNTSVFVL